MDVKDEIEQKVAEYKVELEKQIRDVEGRLEEAKSKVKASPTKWVLIAVAAGVVLATILIGMCSKTGTVI